MACVGLGDDDDENDNDDDYDGEIRGKRQSAFFSPTFQQQTIRRSPGRQQMWYLQCQQMSFS